MSGSRRVQPSSVSPLMVRTQQRRAARRRRVLALAGKGALVLLPLAALGWVLLLSSWLSVDRIEVAGAQRLSAEQVQAAAAVAPGTPLARLDTGALADRVRQLAPVADVRVSRSWPGTLRIAVTERRADAYVLTPSGVRLFDAHGVEFATAPKRPEGVVRLQVHDPGRDDPSTQAALTVHAALPEPLRERVRIVRAGSASTVVLLLDTGKQIVWGAPGDTRTKSLAAQALLKMPGDVFDVSSPGVAVRR